MFKKICSLILILLMVLSVVGVCSAGTITMQYPTLDDISSNTDFYRYSGDSVMAGLFVCNDNNGKKTTGMGWWWKNEPNQLTEFDTGIRVTYGDDGEFYFVNNTDKRLPGYKVVYTIPDSNIGGTIYGEIYDCSYSNAHTWLKISNYKDSNIIIHFWDRGWARDPHIDVRVNGVITDEQNGGNGKDVEFTM
jgi:hypothetical protein